MMKITKGLARKLYNEGAEIMIIPNKVRPNSMLTAWYHKSAEANDTFENLCNIIFYYNCSPETGMTLAFYSKDI